MHPTFWNHLILYGIPVVCILGFLWGGVTAFRQQAGSQQQAPNPDKYRS